jgi:hypothetical protein
VLYNLYNTAHTRPEPFHTISASPPPLSHERGRGRGFLISFSTGNQKRESLLLLRAVSMSWRERREQGLLVCSSVKV